MLTRLEMSEIVSRHGRQIAQVVAGRGSDLGTVRATEVRRSQNCLVFRLFAGGTSAAVKVFDPELKGANASFEREVACQSAMTETGRIPRLLGYSKDDLLVISAWQEGRDLREVVTVENLGEIAREIGAWYQCLASKVASRPVVSNWHAYLSRYTGQGLDRAFEPHAAFLENVPITMLSISKNDAHLSNFIWTPSDTLIGIDFEVASLKPLGWDILLSARTLRRMFPDHADVFLPGLIEGWGEDMNETDRSMLENLARLFADETAFRDLI